MPLSTAGNPAAATWSAGENLTFDELWRRLGAVSGRRPPRHHMPHAVALAAALVDEARCRVTGGRPVVPMEGARMARHRMFVASTRTREELGVSPTRVDDALAQSVRWYRDSGYLAG